MNLIDILDATPFPIGYRLAFLTNFWREPILRKMEKDFGLIRPELTVLMCLSFQSDVHARDICEVTEQPSNTTRSTLAVRCSISRQKVKSSMTKSWPSSRQAKTACWPRWMRENWRN